MSCLIDVENERLVFVNLIGNGNDGNYVYELLFSLESTEAWGEDWEVRPAAICCNIAPSEDSFDLRKVVTCPIKFDLAKKSGCFSMQDCTDGIIPLAWENIDDLEEYPEDGRVILRFGDTYERVEDKLGRRHIILFDSVK